MNESKNWVSRTPSRSIDQEDIVEEDFASAAEAEPPTFTYRSPSPPNPFEQFFLPIVTGEDSSTFALAASRTCIVNNNNNNKPTPQKVSSTRSSVSIASESIQTEDFASATDEFSVNSDFDDISLHDDDNDDDNQRSTIFKDVLGRQAILEETPEEHEIDMSKKSRRHKKHTMATTKKTVTTTEPEPVPTLPPPVTELEPQPTQTPDRPIAPPMVVENKQEFDVVEHVYEGAKSVWAFGKGIFVLSPFMGVAEGAATKMLSITTGVSSLEDADTHIKSTLSNVDKEFIDPAILKLWGVLEPIVGKSEEVLMSVLGVVSKKVPMLEGYTKPETATCAVVVEAEKVCDEACAPETSKPAVVV